jgi:hypothetical protein
LCHRTEGGTRTSEEHSSAILEISNAVGAADGWKFARAGIVRAAGDLPVDRFESGSADFDDRFAVGRDRFGKVLTSWRLPKGAQNSSLHRGASILVN